MKKILIGMLILTLLSWGAWAALHRGAVSPAPGPAATSTSAETSLKTYSDPAGRFAFRYPAAFAATGEETGSSSPTGWSIFSPEPGRVLARVKVPRELFPGTNFSEAWFTVGWSNDSDVIRTCEKDPGIPGVTSGKATIGGREFVSFVEKGAAAGNYYDTTVYRGILDGDCYDLEYTVHTSNIGNYDPSQGVRKLDESALKSELDAIARSFRFNVNSD